MLDTLPVDLDRLRDRRFWQSFAPKLHIEDASVLPKAGGVGLPAQQLPAIRQQLKREGYLHALGVPLGVDIQVMADTVRAFTANGLSPVFGFLYDEFWVPFRKLAPIYKALLGDYALLPEFWIWHVDPARGESGWKPHRDKGYSSIFPDGSPKSLTTWIPLTRATPLNSCMYIVPAMHDPTYGTPEDGNYKFDYQSIRALPAEPGDVMIWNQAVCHWGSQASALGTEPRISMALEIQRPEIPPINPPMINPMATIPFDLRLNLVARQVLQYAHMYAITPQLERFARDVTRYTGPLPTLG
ncbi:MAG: phytanoyl-CoA dioxygenase family protein [Vulcanimicrobiaceae bacterium]